MQDYLKAVFKLQEHGGSVSTSALAESLRVSAPSVTGMMKKLAGLRLLRHHPYQGVVLTKAGQRIALEVIRHHRLLELYLSQALGYSLDGCMTSGEARTRDLEEFTEKTSRPWAAGPTTWPSDPGRGWALDRAVHELPVGTGAGGVRRHPAGE
jgi:DtxR family Mn-dependent transcriptional regulator